MLLVRRCTGKFRSPAVPCKLFQLDGVETFKSDVDDGDDDDDDDDYNNTIDHYEHQIELLT